MHAGYPLDAEAILLVESDGTPEEVAAEMARAIARVLERCGRERASRCRRTRRSGCGSGPAARRRFPAAGRISPDYYCIDGTIPRARAARTVLEQIEALSRRIRAALHERVPRRRRQPASADPVRRQQARRRGEDRSVRRRRSSSCASRSAARSPASTASASRRSTRCASSSARRSSRASAASSARSIRERPAQSGQGACRPCIAARRSAACIVHHGAAAASRAAAFLMTCTNPELD